MSISAQWLPESVRCLRSYSRADFSADLLAGLTVGLVALPLAMAFGIASGVTPQAGLYTAIVAGGLISALGGSRMQIGGPTGAFVVIVAGIVAKFGIPGLALVTLMAGAMLVVMGLTGLGSAVKFIPRPVTIGFTNGIALLIASTQIKDFLGLRTGDVPSAFIPRMAVLVRHIGTASWPAIGVGAASLAIVILLPRFTKRIPGSIVAMLGCTVLVALSGLSVETIGSKFGGIPGGLSEVRPFPRSGWIRWALCYPRRLPWRCWRRSKACLSAVVADSMSGTRHNSNVELVAQGIANLASPLFGGIPATGAIARTATNIRSGARTPIAGVVHAITLLLIVSRGGSARAFRAVGNAGGCSVRGRLQHGRVERDRHHCAAVGGGHCRVGGDVRAHRARRSDRGRGNRNGSGGAVVHLPDFANHDGGGRDAGIYPGRAAAHPAGQTGPVVRGHSADTRTIPVRRDGKAGGSDGESESVSGRW